MTIALDRHGFRLRVAPRHGGAILSAEWTAPGGSPLPLLEPLSDPLSGFGAGCFAMVPFANRIDRGCFAFGGERFRLPVNRPDEDTAIHGFSRDLPWDVVLQTPDNVHLQQDFSADGNPYRYRTVQEIRLSSTAIHLHLAVRNDGTEAMPFGIGLHPWFPQTAQATLSFNAIGAHGRDARGLPSGPLAGVPGFDPAAPVPLRQLAPFDACLGGWQPRTAFIAWPERRVGLRLEAGGAFRHLHVFVPDERCFCAEPVSHFPDAINRPELGPDGAMDVLEPGETLAGAMTFAPVALGGESEHE